MSRHSREFPSTYNGEPVWRRRSTAVWITRHGLRYYVLYYTVHKETVQVYSSFSQQVCEIWLKKRGFQPQRQ